MKLDTFLPPYTQLSEIPAMTKAVEEFGFDGVWVAETQHNPMLACALIAEHSKKIEFGTAIAVSFARSPAVMAHTAWDLSELSGGLFILGLGTQVKPHIERRFGMPWPESPVAKQREQIESIRAIWESWMSGERIGYRGEYYKLTLSSPFFTPSKIDHPDVPIYIAGVNTGLARLAGETANGFHVHPFHTPQYLRNVLLPAVEEGANKTGRKREDVSMVVNAFVITGDGDRETTRQQISFYASTPSYRRVMKEHGWEDVGEKLSKLAAKQQWMEMSGLITDEMLSFFATEASLENLAEALKERYQGLADRLTIYIPFSLGEHDALWKTVRKGF